MKRVLFGLIGSVCVCGFMQAGAQIPLLRPPSVPLITHDPYFSVWSDSDKLTESPTRHWTGHPEPLTGLLRVDGKTFRLMGQDPRNLPAAEQTSVEVMPTHTRYSFTAGGLKVELSFFTPAFLGDMDLLSRPVTYLTWTATATDGAQHAAQVFLSAGADLATSYNGQPVTYLRHETATSEVVSVGTREQAVLNRSGDDLRIDWGYFHLVVPEGEGATAAIAEDAARTFEQTGELKRVDDMDSERSLGRREPHLAAVLPLGQVGTAPVSKFLMVAYTEDYALQLLHRNLRPYWERENKPVTEMLDEAERQYKELDARGAAFDQQLTADLTRAGSAKYAAVCALAYRQAIAAHKLVADVTGEPMLFAKENFSNGDTATVDVLYPSAPIFLFFNPKLLQAQILPVMEYASMPNRWHFPFAPHDLGQYPLANGQTYGGGEKTEEDQMPVEESGNLLILVDALAQMDNNLELARRFWPQLSQWAEYLKAKGLDPENQLTTDDFAGHVAHNSNLSLKAIEAIAAYADLAKRLNHPAEARSYAADAKGMAARWITMAREGDHFKLAFNSPDTWSQKYNLVWDQLLHLDLFPDSVRRTEIAYYKTKLNRYGLPLDSRKDYTKLDWELWTATMAEKPEDFVAIMDPIYEWVNQTPSRVPMTDWYDTKTGEKEGFQARSVVGGLFIKALADRSLAEKWRSQAESGKSH